MIKRKPSITKYQTSTRFIFLLTFLTLTLSLVGCQKKNQRYGVEAMAERMWWPMDRMVELGKMCQKRYEKNMKPIDECDKFEAISKKDPKAIDYKGAADYMVLRQYDAVIKSCSKSIKLKEPLSRDCDLVKKAIDAGQSLPLVRY
jgi:hypothetical protein